MIHVLPGYKYPVEKLPIETFIASKLAWRKKMEKQGKDFGGFDINNQSKRDKMEVDAL